MGGLWDVVMGLFLSLPGDFMGVVTMKKSTEMHPGFMPLCASALYFNTRDLFEKNEKEG